MTRQNVAERRVQTRGGTGAEAQVPRMHLRVKGRIEGIPTSPPDISSLALRRAQQCVYRILKELLLVGRFSGCYVHSACKSHTKRSIHIQARVVVVESYFSHTYLSQQAVGRGLAIRVIHSAAQHDQAFLSRWLN
jgi:hypothetical protein